MNQTSVGDEQQENVLRDEIGAQLAAVLGSPRESRERGVRSAAQIFQFGRAGNLGGEQVGQTAVGGLKAAEKLDVRREAGPGVGVSERLVGRVEDAVEGVREHGAGQRAACREVPVERGVAYPGVPGDVVQRGVESTLAVDGMGGVDERLPVARSVGAQPDIGTLCPRHGFRLPTCGDHSPFC